MGQDFFPSPFSSIAQPARENVSSAFCNYSLNEASIMAGKTHNVGVIGYGYVKLLQPLIQAPLIP